MTDRAPRAVEQVGQKSGGREASSDPREVREVVLPKGPRRNRARAGVVHDLKLGVDDVVHGESARLFIISIIPSVRSIHGGSSGSST
jgi:hypothetical protein